MKRLPCFLSFFVLPSLFQPAVHTAQPPAESPLLRFACALQSRGEGLSAAASRSPPALGRSAPCCPERGAPSEAEAPGELGRSGGRRHCGLPATAPRPGDARTGCSEPPAAACSVPFLRRPSQGLRCSRQTRKGAPEAGSTGGDNPGAVEAWAHLLLLKIGSAVFWEAAWRRGRDALWLHARVDQHLPASIHMWGLRAGKERVFPPGALVSRRPDSWVTVWGVGFPTAVRPLQTPELGQPALVLLGRPVGGRAGAPSSCLNASCSRLT